MSNPTRTMREKMARAMCCGKRCTMEPEEECCCEIEYEGVDAALGALMEPTDEMITAGVDARATLFQRLESEGVDTKNLVVSRHPAGTIFVAMIKAALAE